MSPKHASCLPRYVAFDSRWPLSCREETCWVGTSQVLEKAGRPHLERQSREWRNSEADRVKEVVRCDLRMKKEMARACVTDVGDKNLSPSYPLGIGYWIPGWPRENWLDSIEHDLQDMKLTWQKVEERANCISVWPSASLFQDSKVEDNFQAMGNFLTFFWLFVALLPGFLCSGKVRENREGQGKVREF